jgi:hypothetical protein
LLVNDDTFEKSWLSFQVGTKKIGLIHRLLSQIVEIHHLSQMIDGGNLFALAPVLTKLSGAAVRSRVADD